MMKPRIKKYLRGESPLGWVCSSGFDQGYGGSPKAAYDAWMVRRRALLNTPVRWLDGDGNVLFYKPQQ